MRRGQSEKVQLTTALVASEPLIQRIFGKRFVRISAVPGETFFHVIIDDANGGRRYLEVSVHERM